MRIVRNIRVSAAVAFSLLASLPVWAEEAGGDKGLPQLDASLFPEQLFWLAISFAALYVLMSRIALPRVARTQGNRKHIISSEIEAARAANDAAKAAVAAVDQSLNEARAEAQASVAAVIAKVTEEATLQQMAQEKELLGRLHKAESDIIAARDAAMESVRASAADLSAAVIEKILGSKGRVGA